VLFLTKMKPKHVQVGFVDSKPTLLKYTKLSSKTAIYPDRNGFYGFIYCCLGLAGEAGELLDADVKEIASEGSDVLWYLAQLCVELEIDPQEIEAKSKDFRHLLMMCDCLFETVSAATRVSDIAKKCLRDSSNEVTPEAKDKIQYQLSRCFHGICNISRLLGKSWEELAQMNLDKLYSRMERGKLGGSGDHR